MERKSSIHFICGFINAALVAVAMAGCCMDGPSGKLPQTPSPTSPASAPSIPGPLNVPNTQAAPATQSAVSPVGEDVSDEAQTWQTIAAGLGKTGEAKDHVYMVTLPRDDLKVTRDDMPIPIAAGIQSEFRFYRCPCGKLNVVGQFCVTDYESNDVAAALENARFDVSSMSDMFLYDKPRIMIIRFQAEGDPQTLSKTLHDALGWIGPQRAMPQRQPG